MSTDGFDNSVIFICPETGDRLFFDDDHYRSSAGASYPVVDGVPVLIRDPRRHLERIERLKASEKGAWYDQTQVDYYDHGPYRHALRKRREIVEQWVSRYCAELSGTAARRPLTVLDHGCGDGASSRWLAAALPAGSRLLLTDYNFERIIRARNLLGTTDKQYFLSDVSHPPLAEGSIDLVFSNHVIEHVPDDRLLLEKIHGVLRPGGYLILGCPTEGVFFWMLAYALSPSTIRKSDHIHFYDRQMLETLGRDAGLEHLRSQYTGYGFPHWKVDLAIRRFKLVDDVFGLLGRILFPGQATSIYLLFRKN